MKRLSLTVFAASILLCLAHGAVYHARLPETVYSHFGASGEPDATMGKTAALFIYYGIVALIAGLIAVLAAVTHRMPLEMLNLPHKVHWVSGAQATRTREFLVSHLLWLGAGSLGLMFAVFHLSYRVSLGLADRLPSLGVLLGIYGVFVALWLGVFLMKFLRPAAAQPSST